MRNLLLLINLLQCATTALAISVDDLVNVALARPHLADADALKLWSRVAASGASTYPYSVAMHGILLLRTGSIDDAVALLENVHRNGREDWVAASVLAGAYELVARRLIAHINGTAVTHVVDATSNAAASSPLVAALERVVSLLEAATAWRLRWLQRSKCGITQNGVRGGRDDATTPDEEASGDDVALACAASAGVTYPQLRYVRAPTLMYRGWGTDLQWLGRDAEARAAFSAGVAAGIGWVSPWARPVVPHVTILSDSPRPVFTEVSDACFAPVLRRFEAAIPDFISEFEAVWTGENTTSRATSKRRPKFVVESAGLHAEKRWRVLSFFVDGVIQPAACAAAPRTCAFIAAEPLASVRQGQSKFSVLSRGAHVLPHAGPSNARLRMHCTLRLFSAGSGAASLRVGMTTVQWEHGRCFLFDESFEHEVTTTTEVAASSAMDGGQGFVDDVRAVLIVDIANPLLASVDVFKRFGIGPSASSAAVDAYKSFHECQRMSTATGKVDGA